jgi:hypothetical protein
MTNAGARGAEPIIIAGQFQERPRTSWWTVAEAGDAFTRELREAQARMSLQTHCKLPDLSHLSELRRGGR